jgi:hypothetical protein
MEGGVLVPASEHPVRVPPRPLCIIPPRPPCVALRGPLRIIPPRPLWVVLRGPLRIILPRPLCVVLRSPLRIIPPRPLCVVMRGPLRIVPQGPLCVVLQGVLRIVSRCALRFFLREERGDLSPYFIPSPLAGRGRGGDKWWLRDQGYVDAAGDQVADEVVDVPFEAADAVEGEDGACQDGHAHFRHAWARPPGRGLRGGRAGCRRGW